MRIGAERAAVGGDLRQEQHGRHQRRNAVRTGADLAAQPHHRAGRSASWMMSSEYQSAPASGSDDNSLRWPSGRPRSVHSVCPSGPTISISLTGVVSKTACRIAVDVGRPAADRRPAPPDSSSASIDLVDAGFGERNRPLGGGVDLLLALPVDEAAEPEIERDQGRAGEQHADADRNDIPARECAQSPTHPGVGPANPSWCPASEPCRRKGRLKLKAA